METSQKKIFEAGKKCQEIEDMQLLGAIIETHFSGEIQLSQGAMLRDYWVSREEDPATGNIVLKSVSSFES